MNDPITLIIDAELQKHVRAALDSIKMLQWTNMTDESLVTRASLAAAYFCNIGEEVTRRMVAAGKTGRDFDGE